MIKIDNRIVLKCLEKLTDRLEIMFQTEEFVNSIIAMSSLDEKLDNDTVDDILNMMQTFYIFDSFSLGNSAIDKLLKDKRYGKESMAILKAMKKSKLQLYEILDANEKYVTIKNVITGIEDDVISYHLQELLQNVDKEDVYIACHRIVINNIVYVLYPILLNKNITILGDFINIIKLCKIPSNLLALSVFLMKTDKSENATLGDA